ncbi:T9SS type A sorting domain-containing protein [Taibaiella soli]|uniref:Secretion system C-terminal sorting domain-containing protein n=1 Tax=Taibaiella soli TaxID=1649169 RepID=A0A2W2B812_9BACT|nr:T9SS type A sorting domain-containing protein [Taibaiella soli]PZF72107.1 hypothetical protein DN068_14320 [Taibaiella soli]
MVRKKHMNRLALLALGCVAGVSAKAQLSGTYSIPSATYPTIASVVTALNTQGVGTGGAIINITAGTLETAPAGGYILGSTALNASLTAVTPLVINGNNSTITAGIGTGNADAIFTLSGTDYVTINGLNLNESATNTTNTTLMEWGYNFVKKNNVAPFDGCQNNLIQNCSITLNAANTATCGIRLAHSVPGTNTVLAVTGALTSDANSSNRFWGNTITNTDTAISMRGMNSPGRFDYDNRVGSNTAGQGNTIVIGGGSFGSVAGVHAVYDSVLTFHNNQFSVSPFQTLPAGTVTMAMISTGTGRGDLSIRNNQFNISWQMQSGALFTGTFYAVRNDNFLGSVLGTGHSDINAKFAFTGNSMTGTDTFATSGGCYGLYNGANDWNIDSISNNTFSNIYWSSPLKTTSTGFLRCINETGSNTSAGTHKFQTIMNNTFTNLYKQGVVASGSNNDLTAIESGGNQATSGLYTVMYNKMTNCSANNTVKFTNTGNAVQANLLNPTGQVFIHKYNKMDRVQALGTSAVTTHNSGYGSKGSEMAFDTVTNCRVNTGTFSGPSKSFNGSIHDCYVAFDTTGGGFFTGIALSNGNVNNTCYNNTVTKLVVIGTNTAFAQIIGISGVGGYGSCTIYNNTVSDFSAPTWSNSSSQPTSIWGFFLTSGNYTANANFYYNTVKLNMSSTGANFGVVGVGFGDNLASLDMRNNIVNVNCLPKGLGIVAAVQKANNTNGNLPPTIITNTTGSNIYYVPNSAYCFYYAEGGSIAAMNTFGPMSDPNFNITCLSTYKQWMGQRERTSYYEDNLSAVTGYPGLYAPTSNSYAESVGSPITVPPITVDQLGVTRPATSDAGALQFNGILKDKNAPIIQYAPLPVTTLCVTTAPTLSASIYDATGVNTTATNGPRMYYKKASEADVFGGANTAAVNGWKYVNGTNTSGTNFTFTPDYSLLTGLPVAGDSIVYFVIAEDIVTPANVGATTVAFPTTFCPTSVVLPATASPTQSVTVKNAYTILAPVSPILSPAGAILCNNGGSVKITAAGIATAPTLATLGTDSTFNQLSDDNSPLDGQQYNHRQQMIYTAAELTAQGMTAGVKISAVAVSVGYHYGLFSLDTVMVGLGLTTAGTLSPGNWLPVTQLFKKTVPVTVGMNAYTLNTPFTWDGTSNLVVEICSQKSSGIKSAGVFNTLTPAVMDMYYSDANNGNGGFISYDTLVAHSVTNVAQNFTSSYRPNIQLTFGAPKPISWSPVTGLYKDSMHTIPMTTADTNRVVWAAPTAQTSYTVSSILSGCNSAPSVPSVITPIAGAASFTPSGAVAACDSVKLHMLPAVNLNYQWQKAGANIAGATDSVYSVTSSGNYRAFVTTATPGCTDTSAVSAVTINASPVAIITPGGMQACDSVKHVANTGTGIQYVWQKYGVNITGATSASYTATASGNYRVYEVTAAGCSDTSAVITDTINISPMPIIQVNGFILSTNTVYNGYQWNLNGQPIAGATSNTYLAVQDGNYSLTVTSDHGCIGTSADSVITGLGVTNIQMNHIKVYPNPASSTVRIDSPVPVNVTLHAIDGKVMLTKENATSIDVSTLASGTYLLRISNLEGVLIGYDKITISRN